MNPHDRTWVPMGMLPLFVGLCVPPVAVGAFFYFLHLKVTGETMWHSNHPIAIFGLLVTIGSSLVGGAIAVRLQRWLILRYGTEAQRQEQEFWDGTSDDGRWFEDR